MHQYVRPAGVGGLSQLARVQATLVHEVVGVFPIVVFEARAVAEMDALVGAEGGRGGVGRRRAPGGVLPLGAELLAQALEFDGELAVFARVLLQQHLLLALEIDHTLLGLRKLLLPASLVTVVIVDADA